MDDITRTAAYPLTRSVPLALSRKLLWLPDDARTMGIHIQAGKGSGKSRLMGRLIAWFDFIRGVPLVIFDPHGPTIDNFLDKITRMPRGIQERLWPRVLYVDMSGHSGQVIPFPLYYRLDTESLYEISQRYLDVVRKLDPYLQTASVEGWNPFWRTGTYTGIILAALNFQITEAEKLLRNPSTWEHRCRNVLTTYPEAEPAVSYFQELSDTRENIRNRRTESFFNKISLFSLDPSMKAMFGSGELGVDWKNVIRQHLAVLLDFRQEYDVERRQFKMIWAFNYFMDFVKRRGAGRHHPISLIIDELSSLFSIETLAGQVFSKELDELINVIARNYRVWLTIAHQEQFQLTPRMQKSLMTLGTQVLGATSDSEASLASAKQFFHYDPYLVRKYEATGSTGIRSVEFKADEQFLLDSYNFTNLGRFQFLVRPAHKEGEVGRSLRQISIAGLDQDLFPNEELVTQARKLLMKRSGKPVGEVLVEIENRFLQKKGLSKLQDKALKDKTSEMDKPSLWTY